MRVFVTGGSGLVGRHVIGRLVARGDAVRALARSDAAVAIVQLLGAEPVRGDVTAEPAPAWLAGVDAVVHAAAIVLKRGDWAGFHAVNVAPTERLAVAAARAGGPRFVHISSVAVYGRRTTYEGGAGSVSEAFGLDGPMFPGDHYARSKREAEQALWRVAAETGLRAVALRPCVIYGEGDRTFANKVARVLRGGWAPLVGDGTNRLGVVYAGNVAAATLAALDRPGIAGPFNVANDGALTQRDFLERFAHGLGVHLRLVRVPRGLAWGGARLADAALRVLRPGRPMTVLKTAVQFLAHPNPYVSDKARTELGWAPVVAPEEAVERTGRWFRENAKARSDAPGPR